MTCCHPKASDRGAVADLTPAEATEYVVDLSLAYPDNPRLTALLTASNVRAVEAQIRYLQDEEPARTCGGIDYSAEHAEWSADLEAWMAVRRLARKLAADAAAADQPLAAAA